MITIHIYSVPVLHRSAGQVSQQFENYKKTILFRLVIEKSYDKIQRVM